MTNEPRTNYEKYLQNWLPFFVINLCCQELIQGLPEVGDTDDKNENIRNFLKAMNPDPEELKNLFEEETDASQEEETGEV